MTDIDEILASGRYTDKRGREWRRRPYWTITDGRRVWAHTSRLADVPGGVLFDILDPAQIRLLIERDRHRDVCIGLSHCDEHPAASVVWDRKERHWIVFKPHQWASDSGTFSTFPEAMEAARALAVKS